MKHVTVNKQKLAVRFNFNSLREWEKLTGKNAMDLMSGNIAKMNLDETIILAYVGIKEAGGTLTLEEVARGFNGKSFAQLFDGLIEDMKSLVGEEEEEGK